MSAGQPDKFTWHPGDLTVMSEGDGQVIDLVALHGTKGQTAMPITDEQPSSVSDAVRRAFASLGGVRRNAEIITWVSDQYPGRFTERSIGSHLRGCSVNHPRAIEYHPDFPRFLYNRGRGEFEVYDRSRHGSFDEKGYPEGQAPVDFDFQNEAREESPGGAEFAYEAHLRDYLARNLGLIESGLTLWTGLIGTSTEYAVEGRRVDILAKDQKGLPVVIELKVSRGHERTIGQALYYRGKLKQLLGLSRVRIIMVAAEITDELLIASREVSDVELYCYSLTMQLTKSGQI